MRTRVRFVGHFFLKKLFYVGSPDTLDLAIRCFDHALQTPDENPDRLVVDQCLGSGENGLFAIPLMFTSDDKYRTLVAASRDSVGK